MGILGNIRQNVSKCNFRTSLFTMQDYSKFNTTCDELSKNSLVCHYKI